MSLVCRHSLFTLALLILFSADSTTEQIDCDIPSIFEVKVDDNKKIFVFDAEISVRYSRSKLAVYNYADTNQVNFLVNDSVIVFSGHILQDERIDLKKAKVSLDIDTKIAGTLQLANDAVANCKVYLARRKNDDRDLSRYLQAEILDRARVCLESAVCENSNDVKNGVGRQYDFGDVVFVPSKKPAGSRDNFNVEALDGENVRPIVYSVGPQEMNDKLQSTINVIVDIALAEIVKEMKKEYNGTIKIPDISESFISPILKLSIKFNAYNGHFSDIATLSRVGNASFSHTGELYIASCAFGLSEANIRYNKYSVSYIGVKLGGKVTAVVEGVSVFMTVVVDFSEKPCQIRLMDLRLIKLGDVEVDITGLGPFNRLYSILVSWVTKKWKSDIVGQIEKQVRTTVEDYMRKFDCEKFRYE